MILILSTRNETKAQEIRAMLSYLPIRFWTLAGMSIKDEAVENGDTIRENALIKAKFAAKHLETQYAMAHDEEVWVLGEDTGLRIDALNGLPGPHARRWAGENATSDQIIAHTLNKLRNFQGVKNRRATFETSIVLLAMRTRSPHDSKRHFRGRLSGYLRMSVKVPPKPQMPYGSIFVPSGPETRVLAELSTDEMNEISHRGDALRKAVLFLARSINRIRN